MKLAGLDLQDLEEGSVPLAAVVVHTEELPLWEVTGMLDAALGITRQDLHECWIQDGDDE